MLDAGVMFLPRITYIIIKKTMKKYLYRSHVTWFSILFRLSIVLFASTSMWGEVGTTLNAAELMTLTRESIEIVEDGEPRAMLVIPSNAQNVVKFAAEEIVEYLQQASGARIPVFHENQDLPETIRTRIFLGPTKAASQAGIEVETMDPEGYIICNIDGDFYIVGSDGDGDPLQRYNLQVGALWGAYEFLEQATGVRWLWPGELGTYIPKNKDISLAPLNKSWEPRLTYRNLRSRINSVLKEDYSYHPQYEQTGFSYEGLQNYARDLQLYLRHHRMGGMARRPRPAGHHFQGWWKKYGKTHPEWFMMNADGTRGPEPGNRSGNTLHVPMCVSNSDFHRYIVERWDGRSVLTIGEVDRRDACHCEKCRSWDGEQIDPADLPAFLLPTTVPFSEARSVYNPMVVSNRYARFWKSVLELAKEKNPEAAVSVYLYVNYFPAPTEDIYLGRNIFGEFVPWSNLHAEYFPMSDEALDWVKDQWRGWQQTGMRMGYRPNYLLDGYVMPQVNTYQAGEFFKWAVDHGMEGADFDALTGQWAVHGPKLYLHCRLLSKPDLDIEEVLTEYYEAFGSAAGAVRKYFEYWERYAYDNMWETNIEFERVGSRWQRFQLYAHRVFPPESFEPAERLLQIALEDAEEDTDSQYAERVKFLQLGLEHARLGAKVAAFFDGQRTIPLGTDKYRQARQALIELIRFRKANESKYISDYYSVARPEHRFWDIRGLLDGVKDEDFEAWTGPD